MHAYFGMTWCTHGRKEKRQCLRQPGQARMLTLQALLRSALLSGNCRNSAVILKLASVLLESQESILKGIRVGAGTVTGTRSSAATLTCHMTVISQSRNHPTVHAIMAIMNKSQTQQRRSCRRRPGSVARASRKCHGCNRKTPRRLRVGRELYAEESVQLRAVQEAMKATDSLAVANSDASEMVCHVNHVID